MPFHWSGGICGYDLQDVNEIVHILWVRKAVKNTRALVLTAGSQPTFGIQSLIRDPEILRQRYGMEVVKLPFTDIFKYMDQITDEEANPIAEKLINDSRDTQVNTDWFLNDIKYYLAAKKMMDIYDCNAFSTTCHELCTTEIPQQRKFTPCMCHSILKDEGIPSGCEEDLNALMAMVIMQYAAHRPVFMGNPNYETDELLRIHHAVPALCMNGYGTKPLKYKLWAFTGQGFGGKLQVDFTENEQDEVTLARFNPAGDTMCVKVGKVLRSEYAETYCSPYYYIQMDDAREYMHNLAGFGHHQVLILGNYSKLLKKIGKVMNFKVSGKSILGGLTEPGEVLVTQTEHNSVLRPLLNQKCKKEFPMVVVPCTEEGEITEEALGRSLTENTRVLVVNHCF